MKNNFSRVIATLLCVMMIVPFVPATAFASEWSDNNVTYSDATFGTNGYYNVISQKDWTLVPGAATETELVLNNATGTRRQVLHIIEVDPSNPDVSIVPGYYNVDKDTTDVNNQQAAKLTDMAAYYEDELGYNIVGGMNTDLYYEANAPRILVYNGEYLGVGRTTSSYLGVYKDETGKIYCEVKAYNKDTFEAELASGNMLHAVSVSFAMTVKDGELVTKTEERTSSSAARSMVGVKEDGTLVICMNDGRGANNSVGFCNYELGESMLALGCKWAANCDGGGSSTFLTKRAGEDEFTMRSVPCDGAERPTIHGVFVVSNVAPTGVLNNVDVISDYDYFAPGTTYTFSADAIDTHGYAMDVPDGLTWALSDNTFGTVTGGTFVSNGTLGDVDVLVMSEGNIVGSRTIHIANPTTLQLSATSTTLPYSTAEKVRELTLPIVAMIGEANVFCDGNTFDVTLSNDAAGALDGLKFMATDNTSISGVVITAKYLPTDTTLTYTVTFGKGSEVLYDFEDGDISTWLGYDVVEDWLTENGVANPLKGLIDGGQISYSCDSHTFLSTIENGGMVHNGNNALGVEFDLRYVEFNSWVYAIFYNVADRVVLRDVANGQNATSFGCWVYIPKGFCNPTGDTAGALSMQLTAYVGSSSTSYNGTQLNMQFYSENQKKRVNLNACTEADIPENRWIYVSADLTGYNYVSLQDPTSTYYRAPAFIRMYIKPTRAQTLTYYFDDFTLDYSSAVDDREAPVISDVTYCTADNNIALNGQTVNTNTVSFNATVKDYVKSNAEGLDYSTAAIYIDGVKLDGVQASGTVMGVENVVLSNGTHSIKFEIADKLGNYATLTKTLVIDASNAKSAVTISGHNDLGNIPEYDSVYYIDLNVANISEISSITTTLKLQTANSWELDHMIAAEGYTAAYVYNEISKLATITVTKTGACSLTGEQTLVSIPVRVWSWDDTTNVGGDGTLKTHYNKAQKFATNLLPIVSIDVDVVRGAIAYADGSNGTFGGNLSVATNLQVAKNPWHDHDAELTVLNKDATCTEEGYENRTYCESCGSVVDWGTTIPATGHSYELVDGNFICSVCGEALVLGTELVEVNGSYYYAIAGELVSGWQQIEDDFYYFDPDTLAGADGSVSLKVGSRVITYEFDNGRIVHGGWVTDSNGTRYYYANNYYRATFVGANAYTVEFAEIDGNLYGFDKNGYRFEDGMYRLHEAYADDVFYCFDQNGILTDTITDYTGIFNGYYYKDGARYQAGLIQIREDYYYIRSSGIVAVDTTYYCTYNMTEKFPVGYYTFDSEGKMIIEEKNGIVNENGTLYYYENDVRKQAGLIQIGEDYYYVRSGGRVATGTYYCTYHMTEEFPAGYYTFDTDGRMIID